jgi:hypothetical protein
MNNRLNVVAFLTCITLGISFFYCLHIRAAMDNGHARFPGARTSKDGEMWLGWSADKRIGFVDGYINGRRDGHYAGCDAALRVLFPQPPGTVIPNNPWGRCADAADTFTKGEPTDYSDEITSFYQRFEADRDVPLDQVIHCLSDKQRQSADQIHQWLMDNMPPK